MVRRRCPDRRSGAAAVEFAIVMNLVIIPLMIGVWELGRVVYLQQLVASAAREGARLAAQGQTINQTGSPTQIVTEIAPASNTANQPNVKAAVYQSLVAAGLTQLAWSDVDVSLQFNTDLAPLTATATPAPVGGQPWQGIKGQRFVVTVGLNKAGYDKVKWSVLGLIDPPAGDNRPNYGTKTTADGTVIGYTVEWRMLVDDTFTVNTNLPGW